MFKKILYPVDVQEGEISPGLMKEVVDEVRARGAELFIVYVLPGFGSPLVASYFPADAAAKIRAQAETHLREYVDQHVPSDVTVHPIVAEGTPYREILKAAESHDVDLILMPHRDRPEVEQWLIGSTAMKVVQHARCAVLVLRG